MRQKNSCHILTFAVCIFVRARFYAGNFPYRAWHIGPFRGWRRRGRLRHHLAVESAANTHFRGDCGVAGVLWRLKEVIFITMYCYFTKIYVYSSKKEYIMETTMNTISARIDSKLKTQAENLFNELGMNMSTAITVFLKQSVRLRRIPFEIALDTPNAETLAAMTEANEIASGKRKAKSYKNAKAMIKDILDD